MASGKPMAFAQDGRAISLTELAAANDFPAEELQDCPPSEVSGQWNGYPQNTRGTSLCKSVAPLPTMSSNVLHLCANDFR